jgi:8-oxo-dGTP diphosphatase
VSIYLVRHAAAGDRGSWTEQDWLRPLSNKGHAQARGLLKLLSDARFGRIVSSPYLRCLETVAPLAGLHGRPVEIDDALAEDADLEATLALLKDVGEQGGVLCSHGDMIPAVLQHLQTMGVDLGESPRCEKGSVWVLLTDSGSVSAATYLAPLEA